MNDPQELRQRISSLTDDELIAMVTHNAADYRDDALQYARAELRSRGVDFSSTAAEGTPEEESDPVDSVDPLALKGGRRGACPSCNGPLRVGTLTAEKELTIVFADNHEERFLLVSVCSRCGLVSLAVDLETEVREIR
jgi:hypothetical protein